MSRLDQKYIDNLQKFSDALENVVKLLQDQAKKGGEAGATDSVNTMLGGLDTEKITKIVADLESIDKRTKKIESNTDKILAEVRSAKKVKEGGMFNNIEDPKNKAKIVDGIKSVVLIAGAIMAIGLAFKIVGKVDFLTVVGLSISLYILAETFAKIAEIKGLTKNKAILTGQILGIMAIGLVVSSLILSTIPTIGFSQLFSIIGVSIALIPAAYAFSVIIDSLKKQKKENIIFASFALPIIAAGLLLSSFALSQMPSVGFTQILSAIGVGIAMIPVSIAFAIIIQSLKKAKKNDIIFASLAIPAIAVALVVSSYVLSKIANVGWGQMFSAIAIGIALIPVSIAFALILFALEDAKMKDIVFASLAIPAIAMTLLVSSFILSKMVTLDNFFGVILTSLAIGLSVLFLLPAFIIIAKVGLKPQALFEGALAVIVISGVIMISSWILSIGKYDNYPSWKWALGVGLSLIAFLPAVLVLGLVAISGVGIAIIALGAIATLAVAGTIMAASWILSQGKYDKYPSLEWASGVGLSLAAFAITMAITGVLLPLIALGVISIMLIAKSIKDMSLTLNEGNYKSYPSLDWAKGVGTIMKIFADSVSNVSFGLRSFGKVKLIGKSIVSLAEILSENSSLFKDINLDWASNLQNVLSVFRDLPDTSKAQGLNSIILTLQKLSTMGKMNIDPILNLASAISALSKSLSDLNTEGVEKLLKLSGGVMILSLVDQVKLTDVIESLNDKKKELAMILDEKSSPFVSALMSSKGSNAGSNNVIRTSSVQKIDNTQSNDINEEQLKVLKDISRQLDGISNRLEKVESATSVGLG